MLEPNVTITHTHDRVVVVAVGSLDGHAQTLHDLVVVAGVRGVPVHVDLTGVTHLPGPAVYVLARTTARLVAAPDTIVSRKLGMLGLRHDVAGAGAFVSGAA
ncbi:hypothetical protein ABFT23_05040 [Nocardioides sp. C4-1]|uniref:hypothetical protein n=1 Tax=Nocardioides sp. C4-1 TaxID=3151851 RepID=UPI0032670B3E